MKLSCSAIAWGQIKDVPQFKRILKSLKETGYEGVGIEYNLLPPYLMKHPERIKEMADEAGLAVPSMAINENTLYMAEATQKMGAESAWLCLFEKDGPSAAKVTKKLLKAFENRGLKIGVHPHVRSNIETEKQLDQLIKAVKPMKLDVCYDSAHQEALGMDQAAFIKKYHDKIVLAHLKDLKTRVSPAKLDYDRDFVDLGKGLVDFKVVVKALKGIDYRGWLMIEVDFPHKESVEESVKKNFDYLNRLL
jgi:sugar phosphate isomerase/epimerase